LSYYSEQAARYCLPHLSGILRQAMTRPKQPILPARRAARTKAGAGATLGLRDRPGSGRGRAGPLVAERPAAGQVRCGQNPPSTRPPVGHAPFTPDGCRTCATRRTANLCQKAGVHPAASGQKFL